MNKTVKGLVITSVAMLSATYAVQKYIQLRNKKEIKPAPIEEPTVENKTRNYYEIGKVVVENGRAKVKSIVNYKKAM